MLLTWGRLGLTGRGMRSGGGLMLVLVLGGGMRWGYRVGFGGELVEGLRVDGGLRG